MLKTCTLVAAIASVGAALGSSTAPAQARPGFHGGFAFHRPFVRPQFRPHWQMRWQRPLIYGVGAAAAAAPAYAAVAPSPAVAPRPAAGPCTCLTKEYTPDKLVVFSDRCTKEVAAAPVGGTPQQGEMQPQDGPGDAEPMPTK